MKQWWQRWAKQLYRCLFALFFLGFVFGVLAANLGQGGYRLESLELLQLGGKRAADFDARVYFLCLLQKRFGSLWCFFLLGMTAFGSVSVGICCLWYGFLAGLLLTAALLQLGVQGIGWLVAAVFPQGIFYALAIFLFFARVFRMSEKIRTGQPHKQRDYGSYTLFGIGCFLLLLWGVLLEAYVNPLFLEKLWEYLK